MKYERYEVGSILYQLRRAKKLTRDEVSEITGLSVSTITQLELGTRNLSLNSLYSFMNAYDCDANTILNIPRRKALPVSVDAELEKLTGTEQKDCRDFFIKTIGYFCR